MFQGRPVRLSFVCDFTGFGSFADWTSKDGHGEIHQQGFRHYLVCRTPRLIFQKFNSTNDTVNVLVQTGPAAFENRDLRIEAKVGPDGKKKWLARAECKTYPEIVATTRDGEVETFANTFEFLSNYMPHRNNLLLLEVIYVGKTEPTKDYLRLDGHEKYTEISDWHAKTQPQSELFIKLLKFHGPVYEYGDDQESPPASWSDSVAVNVGEYPMDQQVSLIEAALIYALKPDYNTHYKTTFPSRRHTTYDFVYDKDIDSVEILVNEQFRRYRWKLGEEVGNVLYIEAPINRKKIRK